jgi:hypothetical protein
VKERNALAKLAVVLGGASCVWADLEELRGMANPDIVVAVNDVGTVYPHELHHWASYHAGYFTRWVEQRQKNGLPGTPVLWTGKRLPRGLRSDIKIFDLFGGSSGLLGAHIAMQCADRVVLAGVPMDPTMQHYHGRDRGKPWKDAKSYHRHWQVLAPRLRPHLRSMSGWTRDLLGSPTPTWLQGEDK